MGSSSDHVILYLQICYRATMLTALFLQQDCLYFNRHKFQNKILYSFDKSHISDFVSVAICILIVIIYQLHPTMKNGPKVVDSFNKISLCVDFCYEQWPSVDLRQLQNAKGLPKECK